MKKIFGNRIIGVWFLHEPYFDITPRELEEKQEEFEWKADNQNYPNNLYPYKDGQKLLYDEEV